MRTLPLLSLLMVVALGFGACGDDDDPPPTGGGSDEDYLAAMCTGISNFSDALISKTTAEEIGEVIQAFIDEMKALDPPADMAEYNEQFIQYLEDALGDPTSLVTRNPPAPPEGPRDRLADKEAQIDECKDATFFSRESPE